MDGGCCGRHTKFQHSHFPVFFYFRMLPSDGVKLTPPMKRPPPTDSPCPINAHPRTPKPRVQISAHSMITRIKGTLMGPTVRLSAPPRGRNGWSPCSLGLTLIWRGVLPEGVPPFNFFSRRLFISPQRGHPLVTPHHMSKARALGFRPWTGPKACGRKPNKEWV